MGSVLRRNSKMTQMGRMGDECGGAAAHLPAGELPARPHEATRQLLGRERVHFQLSARPRRPWRAYHEKSRREPGARALGKGGNVLVVRTVVAAPIVDAHRRQ